MSMIVHNVEQGTPEWHHVRAGVITASWVDRIRAKVGGLTEQQALYVQALQAGKSTKDAMLAAGYKNTPSAAAIEIAMSGKTPGDWSDPAKDYAFKLALERIIGTTLEDDEFNTWQAVRGTALEEEARMEHELAAGVMVEQVGFITTEDGKFGASPDGWFDPKGVAEYKAYNAPAKLRRVLLDKDTTFVQGQCQMNMALSGRSLAHFGLYVPQLRVINRHFTLIEVPRDDEWIEGMWPDLLDFDKLVESYRAKLLAGEVPEVPATAGASAEAKEAIVQAARTAEPPPKPATVAPDALPENIF